MAVSSITFSAHFSSYHSKWRSTFRAGHRKRMDYKYYFSDSVECVGDIRKRNVQEKEVKMDRGKYQKRFNLKTFFFFFS